MGAWPKFLVVAFASAVAAFAQNTPAGAKPAGGCTVVIVVTGARNAIGGVGGLLFQTPDGYPEDRDKAFVRGTFPIEGGQSKLTFEHVPAGKYAVVVLHDENKNHKLDRNFIRIPKEGFGFGNNPKVGLSAPRFADATVAVGCPTTEIPIRLQYK